MRLSLQHGFAYVAVKVAEFLYEVFAMTMSLLWNSLPSDPRPVFYFGMNVLKSSRLADSWDLLC